jgi:hypothetical protein
MIHTIVEQIVGGAFDLFSLLHSPDMSCGDRVARLAAEAIMHLVWRARVREINGRCVLAVAAFLRFKSFSQTFQGSLPSICGNLTLRRCRRRVTTVLPPFTCLRRALLLHSTTNSWDHSTLIRCGQRRCFGI